METLYTENYKILLRIQEDLNRQTLFTDGKTQYCCQFFSKLSYRFNAVLVKIPRRIFLYKLTSLS